MAGDPVLLNVAALERGLGTGGLALVIAVLGPDGHLAASRLEAGRPSGQARYMPLQAMVAGADEQGSPHHELLRDALAGMPVIVADLHRAWPRRCLLCSTTAPAPGVVRW